MEREKVLGLFGSKVRTGTGFKNLMGNFNPSVGDYIYTDSGYVFGHESVQGRLPIATGTNRADGYGFWLCLGYAETIAGKTDYYTDCTSFLYCRDVFFAVKNDKIIKIKESDTTTEKLERAPYDELRLYYSRIYGETGKKSEFSPFAEQEYCGIYAFNGLKIQGEFFGEFKEKDTGCQYCYMYSSVSKNQITYLMILDGFHTTQKTIVKIVIDKNNRCTTDSIALPQMLTVKEELKIISEFATNKSYLSSTNFSYSLNNRDFSVDINGNLVINYGESIFFLNLNTVNEITEYLKYSSTGRYYYSDECFRKTIGMTMHDSDKKGYFSGEEISYILVSDLLKKILIANVGKDRFIFTFRYELAGFPIFLMKCEKDKDNNHTTTILDVYVTGRDGAFMTAATEGVKL